MIYFSPTGSISNLVERMYKGKDLRGVRSRMAIQGAENLMQPVCLGFCLCVPSADLLSPFLLLPFTWFLSHAKLNAWK